MRGIPFLLSATFSFHDLDLDLEPDLENVLANPLESLSLSIFRIRLVSLAEYGE
jgi:hypothetical protein